jgi:SAM-dependent methyltransferase
MRERDIRPDAEFQEYLRLSAEDAADLLGRAGEFVEVVCPACEEDRAVEVFVKDGFHFRECAACGSIYASPRPTADLLHAFYADSRSSAFWAEVFWPAIADSRLEHVIRPRVAAILRHARLSSLGEDLVAVDVGAGAGAFLAELREQSPSRIRVVAIEPGKSLAAQARARGLEVFEMSVEDPTAPQALGDLVTTFEVIEHVFNPLDFVRSIHRVTAESGLVLCTGLGGDGLDIRVLRERASAVSVPHHLNFLSVRGLRTLFERAGFVDVAVETPGQLDVELVAKGMAAGVEIPDFLRVLLAERGSEVHAAFQRFLVDARLSSHTWVWATR